MKLEKHYYCFQESKKRNKVVAKSGVYLPCVFQLEDRGCRYHGIMVKIFFTFVENSKYSRNSI